MDATLSFAECAQRVEMRLAFQRTLVARYRCEVFALGRSVNAWKRLAIMRGLEVERLERKLRERETGGEL